MSIKRMSGAVAPIVTPMNESGEVDFESLSSLTEHLIRRGLSALYPCGTTGEVKNLTSEERKKIAATVIRAADHRIPVFVQIGGGTTQEGIELAEHAWRSGADGIGILTPTYYHLNDDELFEYYKTIAGKVPDDFPIYLYGIPGCAANELSASLVSRIAERCPNVVGIKYSVGDILTLMQFMKIRKGEFDVFCAPAQMLLPALAVGAAGLVSGGCNVFVEKVNELIDLVRKGNIEEARKVQGMLAECADFIAEKEAAKCKALLARAEVIRCDAMRAPQQGLEESEKQMLFDFIDTHYMGYSYKEGGMK